MKASTKFLLSCAVAGAAFLPAPVQAAISMGDLVVVRAHDGSSSISSAAAATFLEEFTTSGTPVQTIALPTADSGGNQTFTLQGSATSEGFIKLSTNGQYLALAGYDAAPGTASPNGATSATINRVVARVDIGTQAIDTTTALNNAHSAGSVRGAFTTNGTDIWTGGAGSSGTGLSNGVTYTTLGATTSTRINDGTGGGSNRRVVNVVNGQLYVSGSTTGGPNFAVNTVGTGAPTTIGQGEVTLPGMPTTATHSTYDFWFKDAQTVYLADDGSVANLGGIQKWTESGGTWTLQYTMLNNGTTNTPVRGLAGYVDGFGNAVLFATTNQTSANNLITVTDAGVDIDTSTTLATAATNTVFRGVEYIPVPEPTGMGALAIAALIGFRRSRKA